MGHLYFLWFQRTFIQKRFTGAVVYSRGQDLSLFAEHTKHKLNVFQYLHYEQIRYSVDISQDIIYKTSSRHDVPHLPGCMNQAEKSI